MVKGYQKTSLSSIAQKLGITKPALYYYFPSKKELFLACINTFFTHISSMSSNYRSDSTTTKDKIRDVLMNFSQPSINLKQEWQVDDFNHFYFIFDAIKNVPEVSQLYMEACAETLNQLQRIIEEGIQKGELKKDIDVEALLLEIGVLIEGFAIGYYMGYFKDNEGMIERIFELIWNGLK